MNIHKNSCNQPAQNVHQIRKYSQFDKYRRSSRQKNQGRYHNQAQYNQKSKDVCKNCGKYRHKTMSECPAKGVKCHKCSRLDHYAKVCRSGKYQSVHAVSGESAIKSEHSESDNDDFYVYTVNDLFSHLTKHLLQ